MSRQILNVSVTVGENVREIPFGAEPIFVAEQGGLITVWFEGESDNSPAPYTLHVYGTGWPIRETHVYVGTALIGNHVWHVYREGTTGDLVRGGLI